jgi:hypothetical protein
MCARSLRKNYCGTVEIKWPARLGQPENRAQDARNEYSDSNFPSAIVHSPSSLQDNVLYNRDARVRHSFTGRSFSDKMRPLIIECGGDEYGRKHNRHYRNNRS